MSEQKRTEIASLGEFGLIERLKKQFPLPKGDVLRGIGDDAAVLDYSDQPTIVLSTDLLVEGIHFDLMYVPLKHLGYKAVVVNLSDIYAMNAVPRQITVSISVSNRFSVEALDELYSGISAACKKYKIDLVGGDTTSSPRGLVISVTAIGAAAPEDLVYRNTAKVGDLICVSGDLGAAYLGLQLLEREKQLFLDDPKTATDLGDKAQYLVGRQLKPEARQDIIAQLRQAGVKPTSMIDISDGLASDLHHICQQSNVGALILEDQMPIHLDAKLQAIDFGLDPATCALSGGEDYELLFTIAPQDFEKVQYLDDIYVAGEIVTAEQGLQLQTPTGRLHNITAQGWSHFGKK